MRLHICAFLLSGSLTAACAAAQSPADDAADVRAAVNAFQTAMDTGDGPTVMKYIADDALMMEAGTIENRMEYEKNHLPADLEFAKGMTAKRMPVQQSIRGDVAWLDEDLETANLGAARGSAVLVRGEDGVWRIAHYNLAITVPNERFDEVRALLRSRTPSPLGGP